MPNRLSLLLISVFTATAQAATIYPLDRATILAGSPFDFKVEFDQVIHPQAIELTVNGQPYKTLFGAEAEFVAEEKGKQGETLGSALLLRNLALPKTGAYRVEVRAGDEHHAVTWDVYTTGTQPKARNIIFLLGDGLSVAHRTGARIMSKGMTEGKANGHLNMDGLERMAFIGTSSTGSIATDSANTMSAYMTGHKSAVNALGVYADRTPASQDDPKIETLGEALRRQTGKAIGIVTTSELQDATPAAVVAHTRRRADKADITGMLYNVRPEVVLGGGSAYFLPQSTLGSKRKDDRNFVQMFRDDGYTLVTDRHELAAHGNADKLLGLFHTGNLDSTLDREQLHKGTVEKFPAQPGLVDMTRAALGTLSRHPEGFFLMVEAANIDKMSHPLDWERALFDTIEFDQAIGVAREFAAHHPDTLIVVTGDHTHGVSIVGTIDDDKPGTDMREKVGVYADAGFPNYIDADGDGYPDRVDVSRRLAIFANNGPDHYETFQPKLDGPFVPALQNDKGEYVANAAYQGQPGAVLRTGIIPRTNDTGVHAVDDVVLQAEGPGSEAFRGYMEQSDVYRVLADVFALGARQ